MCARLNLIEFSLQTTFYILSSLAGNTSLVTVGNGDRNTEPEDRFKLLVVKPANVKTIIKIVLQVHYNQN